MQAIVAEARDRTGVSELPHAEPALQLPDRGARVPVGAVERDGVRGPPSPAVDDPPVRGAQHGRVSVRGCGLLALWTPLFGRLLQKTGHDASQVHLRACRWLYAARRRQHQTRLE